MSVKLLGFVDSSNDKFTWEVHVKGGPNKTSFEICVIRSDNAHGFSSYGWFDRYKLLISSSGGPCKDPLIKEVWDKLIIVAQEVANELNEKGNE